MSTIEIRDVSCVYSPGTAFEKTALSHIDLTIREGELLGLIGHTGSGKSTLVQHLNALLKPTGGQILLDGEDINADKAKLKSVRQRVGLVFQYPEHQLFEMTIYKDVAFGPQNLGLSEAEVDARVRESLALVGVPEELFEKSPFELSGGQKRRVAIAGVLAMRPQILILDEPAAGLDPRGRDEILQKIKEMRDALGITVVLVSHSMEDIGRLVERIVVINKGELAMVGTPAEVFRRAGELEQMGLAAPQSAYLMEALRAENLGTPETIYTVEAATEAIFAMLQLDINGKAAKR